MVSNESVAALVEAVTQTLAAGGVPAAETLGALGTATDVLALGAMADDARRARHGQSATYLRVHDVDVAAPEPWSAPAAAAEVRLEGRPATIAAAADAARRARAIAGATTVRGFWLADLEALGPDVYAALRSAGLDEVAYVSPAPGDAEAVGRARAAGLGVRVIAVDDAAGDRLAWLLAARRLADAVGGIAAVAPLPRRLDRTTPTTGFADVRTVALARLVLADVPSVQVDWGRYGPKLAQVALTVGADDLDGVSPLDDPGLGPRRATAEDVRRNIASAGLTPVERDGSWAPRSR